MDIAAIVAEWLNDRDEWEHPALVEVPTHRPDRFALVTQTGGSMQQIGSTIYMIDVDCWAESRAKAWEMGQQIIELLTQNLTQVINIFGVEISSFYDNRDLDTNLPRYTIGAYIYAS